MTNNIRLFSTGKEKDKTIWYWKTDPKCCICDSIITDIDAVFIVDWDKKKGRIDNLMHIGCVSKYVKSPLSVTQYRWSVLLTDVIPPKSIPIFIPNPSFSPSKSNVTVFDVDKIKSDRETDNAWRSKRYPSLEGATVGKSLEEVDAERLNEELLIDADPLAFLKEQQSMGRKAISEENKKVIEDKNARSD